MLRIPSYHFYSTKQMFELIQIFTYAFNVGSNAEMCLTEMAFSVQLLCDIILRCYVCAG